jgi:hypothetical protein
MQCDLLDIAIEIQPQPVDGRIHERDLVEILQFDRAGQLCCKRSRIALEGHRVVGRNTLQADQHRQPDAGQEHDEPACKPRRVGSHRARGEQRERHVERQHVQRQT